MSNNLEQLEEKSGVKFHDQKWLKNAFVHRSYLNENPGFDMPSNERLEFLGDAVLELVVTEYLYKNFNKDEGELTALRSALVRGAHLSSVAKELEFEKYLLLSSGEKNNSEKARSLILANTFEAFIGAVYMDSGYEHASLFVNKYIIKNLPEIIEEEKYIDAKSKFQEIIQEKFKITPVYKQLSESGPDHNKIFISGVFVGDEMIAEGTGNSKNNSEQQAAKKALSKTLDLSS